MNPQSQWHSIMAAWPQLALAALLAMTWAVPARALDLDTRADFNITPQKLATALVEFSRQANTPVVSASAELDGRQSPGVQGTMSLRDALKALLAGTRLSSRPTEGGAIAVGIFSAAPAARGQENLQNTLRLARVDGADPDGVVTDPPARAETSPARGIPEILVKGRRSSNADIQRTVDDIQPYVVFDARTIEQSMAGDLESFLRTRLPMNAAVGSDNQSELQSFGNQSSINLRGLGANQTLILVNGRRLPGVSNLISNGDFRQPDINGIPLSAIERIEVLPSTASGIYGGGATGGVVNIILKSEYTGFEVKAGYENTFDTDAARRRLEASAGFTLEGGRTRVFLAASHSDANPLLAGDRDFARMAQELKVKNTGNTFYTAFSPFIGATTNIKTQNNSDLVLKEGNVPLGSPFTFVPYGYAGPQSDGGAALVANAGAYNLELPQGPNANGLGKSVLGHPTVQSVAMNLRREFGERVEAFVDLARLDNEGSGSFAWEVPSILTLSDTDPANPFTTGIRIAYPSPDLQVQSSTRSETLRGLAGLIVRLPHDWTAQGDYSWNRSRTLVRSARGVYHTSLDAAIRSGELDVFADLNAFPMDAAPYLLPLPNYIQGPSDTTFEGFTLRLGGPVLQSPGGPLTLTGMVEHRREAADDTFFDFGGRSGTAAIRYYPHRHQSVDSAYLETLLPLVSSRNARPGARLLEMQISVRRDEYTTNSVPTAFIGVPDRQSPLPDLTRSIAKVDSTDYTAGLRYAPVEALTLRASYGTGFLPPSIAQIASQFLPPGFSTGTNDPQRGGEFFFLTGESVVQGGNPNLQPEESTSLSAGLIFTPRLAPGLRLSIDYTDIRKVSEISSLPASQILLYEAFLPGRVTRAPLEPDAPENFTAGPVIALDTTLLNIARTRVRSVDLQLNYSLEAGRFGAFDFHALASRQLTFERQPVPTADRVDHVGYGSGPLTWRGNGGVTWQRGELSLGWNAQYYASPYVYSPDALFFKDFYITQQGADRLPSQLYHDLFARYRFEGGRSGWSNALANSELTFGIQNVFDRAPPVLATSFFGYSAYGDPRMRRYALSLALRF